MKVIIERLRNITRDDVIVTTSGCLGLCSQEPIVTVEILDEDPIRYVFVDGNKMRQIFKKHVLEGEIQDQFVLAKGSEHA